MRYLHETLPELHLNFDYRTSLFFFFFLSVFYILAQNEDDDDADNVLNTHEPNKYP